MVFQSQFHLRLHPLLRRRILSRTKLLYTFSKPKPFSSLSQSPSDPPPQPPKPTSLSARMSFVFDQIDAIERDRKEKDETLQRIRAWRQSKSINNPSTASMPPQVSVGDSSVDSQDDSATTAAEKSESSQGLIKKEVELAHPWPEWLELMERLVQQNYFDHKRKDEDRMIEDLGFSVSEASEEQGFDFTRDFKTVQNAVLNFGRDRFDILRSLSRQDLQFFVGYGCPSTDKRVTFSAKVLRKHVHLDEGDVCSSCSLRSSCERAYLLTNKEDEARTVDVVRLLLTYGFDPINGSVINKSLLKIKSVKTVVRKLLHEVVKLSAVPIDPNLPPPVIKKPPPKVKQPPPPPKKRVGRDDIEMKKGDWLCPKCDFMNFAKNTVCLQCDAKRPKRQLLPGEWECPQCNFLNYRRNVVCFHCESKRPPDEFTQNQMQERPRSSGMRLEKVSRRPEVSNAWNFDFDDDESDGADVAAFEYADSAKIDEDFPLDKPAPGDVPRDYQNSHNQARVSRMYDRDFSASRPMKPGTGFNDFDDEDDDVDNYELDSQNEAQKTSRIDFSELEDNSESDDFEGLDIRGDDRRQTSLQEGRQSSRLGHRKLSSSLDDEIEFGSDDDLPIHPNWKSSHVANPRRTATGGGDLNFGSDDEHGFSSGADDHMDENFRPRKNKSKLSSNGRGLGRRGGARAQHFSDYESDDDMDFKSRRNSSMERGPRTDRRNSFKNDFDASSRGPRSDRRNNSKNDFDASTRGPRTDRRNSFNDFDKSPRRSRDSQNFGGPKARGSYNQRQRRSDNYSSNNSDSYYDDDRFRRPRNNVR